VAFEGTSALKQHYISYVFKNYMFYDASAFNQPIGGWDVSNNLNFVSNDKSVYSNDHSFGAVSNFDAE
jgi:hypothetical protein